MDFEMRMKGFYIHSVCLPEEVLEQFASFVGKLLEFKCQGSESWHVGLIRSGDRLVLQDGWCDFAHANNIWQEDLLLFKFLGGSKFEVQIFDPDGYEIDCHFEGEVRGEVKVQEGSISRSSSRIKTITRVTCSDAKANTVESNPATRKRSRSQNQSSLSSKKRLKMSSGESFSKEKDKSLCNFKEVHTIPPQQTDEVLESEGENDISAGEELKEWEKEGVEDCRRDYLLVCEHQALLRRKMQLLDTKTTMQKEHIISAGEKFNDWKKEAVEECRRNYSLVCEHQALLRRKMQLPNTKTATKKEKNICAGKKFNEWKTEGIEEYRRNYLLVCEHQALLRRKMQLPDMKTATQSH